MAAAGEVSVVMTKIYREVQGELSFLFLVGPDQLGIWPWCQLERTFLSPISGLLSSCIHLNYSVMHFMKSLQDIYSCLNA